MIVLLMARRERIPPKEEKNFAGGDEGESLDGVIGLWSHRCCLGSSVFWVFMKSVVMATLPAISITGQVRTLLRNQVLGYRSLA